MNGTHELRMNAEYASAFARIALAHVTREYPNKLDHVLVDGNDALTPRALHPIFFGSFDWHSCVHGYWLLARLLRRYPDISEADSIRALFDSSFTQKNVTVEAAYAAHSAHRGFERPYGWAWLLMLQAELLQHDGRLPQQWSRALQPLADVFVSRFHDFLPKATYAVRVGTHFNSAFAILLGIEYACVSQDEELQRVLKLAAIRWFTSDSNAPAWEPGGDDFLSPTLVEAACMSRVLSAAAFDAWFHAFMPNVQHHRPQTLFTPAIVSDRSDGKIAHLDGLNLSRAWCWRLLAKSFVDEDARRAIAVDAAIRHLQTSLPHVAGEYAGEHWLATYALLALEAASDVPGTLRRHVRGIASHETRAQS